MKITIEIIDEKLKYNYEVGTSKQAGEMDLKLSNYVAIAEITTLINNHLHFKRRELVLNAEKILGNLIKENPELINEK